MVDVHNGQTTQKATVQKVNVKLPIRLVLYGGARKSGDNGAFFHASQNVQKDYKNDLPVTSKFLSQGMPQLVSLINSQAEDTVQSLDLFFHGSSEGLYSVIGASQSKTIDAQTVYDDNLASNLYKNGTAKLVNWSPRGSADWGNCFTIKDINFKVFTNESKIEIHGCNTAKAGGTGTFSAILSEALFDAGKTSSVVIGHATAANPNIGGTDSVSQQDYRHGLRILYQNGKKIAETRESGRLSAQFIKKALSK